APGKTIVYLGCAFLILGIFAMLYIRERRIWVWLAPLAAAPAPGNADSQGGTDAAHSVPESAGKSQATMALSTNRKTMDGDKEFEMLKTKLLQAPQ
ncbi:MAG: ResB family protein, partial [Polaromonas sp.]|nr:ResB family protein [Polaromonas sp.]